MNRSFSHVPVTPSYDRICERFRSFMIGDQSADVGHLVLALLSEESLGGKCLADLGITIAGVAEGCFGSRAADTATLIIEDSSGSVPGVVPFREDGGTDQRLEDVDWFQRIRERATFIARRSTTAAELSSEHLVQAMVEVAGPARSQLERVGLTSADVMRELWGEPEATDGLAVDFNLALDDQPADTERPCEPTATPDHQSGRVLALIDANLNRAREGLRVLEDCARFVVHNERVTRLLKELRHELVAAESLLSSHNIQQWRNTEDDAGTSVTTASESRRRDVTDVVTANARRVQESLRSLEEFGKILCGEFGGRVKQLRYRAYDLEQKLRLPTVSDGVLEGSDVNSDLVSRIRQARLYFLVSENMCHSPWESVVEEALAGGAHVIQLREKNLNDDELVRRGQWVSAACKAAGALFILNDRADLVQRAGAHGVHVGQEDDSVARAREFLAPGQLVGVSTHNVDQVHQAIAAGADYLGVGPVFLSGTKAFSETVGLRLVKQVAGVADRPWFAIGGIHQANVEEVLSSGATGVAVCGAIADTDQPRRAAAELRRRLNC